MIIEDDQSSGREVKNKTPTIDIEMINLPDKEEIKQLPTVDEDNLESPARWPIINNEVQNGLDESLVPLFDYSRPRPITRTGLPEIPPKKEGVPSVSTLRDYNTNDEVLADLGPIADAGRNSIDQMIEQLPSSSYSTTMNEKGNCKPCAKLSKKQHKFDGRNITIIGDSHIPSSLGSLSDACPLIIRAPSEGTFYGAFEA